MTFRVTSERYNFAETGTVPSRISACGVPLTWRTARCCEIAAPVPFSSVSDELARGPFSLLFIAAYRDAGSSFPVSGYMTDDQIST